MEPDTGHHGTGHPVHAHEKTDAGIHAAGILGGAFVILLVFGLVTGYLAFRFFNAPASVGPPASPLTSARVLPNGPRLQVNAHEDLLEYMQRQQQTLTTYGWLDQKAGVVRVPIDQAMDMVLKNGLQVRGAATPAGAQKGTTAKARTASQ